MGRYIRIVKADEKEGEEPPKEARKRRRPEVTEQQIKRGRRGLRRYMNNLKEYPPRYKEGDKIPSDKQGKPYYNIGEINYDLLYNQIIYANNMMFADLFDMDEEARMKSIKEEGKASVMSVPMLTKPVLSHLDKMIEHFGAELGFRKSLDEEDNGALKDEMKRHFVPPDISAWMDEGLASASRSLNRQKAQKGVLNFLKNKSSHPIATSTVQDMEDVKVKGGIRVAPSRGQRRPRQEQMPGAFQEQMDDLAGKAREQLGEVAADRRLKDREKAARDLYQQKIFPKVDYDAFRVQNTVEMTETKSNAKRVVNWREMIQQKAKEEGISPKQAVPLVQEDLNNYMRVFLQTNAVGSAGRGGRFGREAIAGESPDLVTPSFYLAAKKEGKILNKPNAHDDFTKFYLKGEEPNSKKARMHFAEDKSPLGYEDKGFELHPAIHNAAYSDDGIFRQVAESEGVSRLAAPTAASSPQQETERAGETTAVGTELSDVKLDTKRDTERAKRFVSRGADNRGQVTRDYRLVDLDNMRQHRGMSDAEYQYHYDKVINSAVTDYSPTYFSEMPSGSDFPEGHPYRDLTGSEIEDKSRKFMDMLVGSGRHILQFKSHLHKLGLPVDEVKSLNLHAKDMENLHTILHADDPYAELGRFNDAQQSRYQRVLETGVSAGYLNKLNKDLIDLRNTVEEIGIDPIDIAEMGMQYANAGFTTKGYEQAWSQLFGKYGDDISKGPMLRTLYAWKRANDQRARVTERLEEVHDQTERYKAHQQMTPEERENNKLDTEECKACHLSHFSNEGPNRDHPHLGGQPSAIRYSRVMMPQLDYRYDVDAKKSSPIQTASGDDSLLNMAAYLFSPDNEDQYMESMLRRYGMVDKEGEPLDAETIDRRGGRMADHLKKQIKKAVVHLSSPHHARAQTLAKEFGLDVRDEVKRPRGFARRTPHQRQALGVIHPSAFQNDAQRERTRLRNLHAQQFSGVVEAFDIIQDLKSGALTDEDGNKVSLNSLNKRSNRRKLVASMFGKTNEARRREVSANRIKALQQYLARDIDGFKDHEADFNAQYGERIKNGDLTEKKNPEGYAKIMQRYNDMKNQFAEDIVVSMQRLQEKTMSLAKNGKAGDRIVELSRDDFLLHSLNADKLKISLGGQPNKVIDAQPPKREGDNYKLILAEPLESDIYATESTNENGEEFDRTELQIVDKNHSSKLLTFDMQGQHMKDALAGQITDLDGFVRDFEKKVKARENQAKRTSSDVDYSTHRNQIAFGAFLKIGDHLKALAKEKDNKTLFNKLTKLTRDLYTDEEGMPIDDIFMSDGYGEESRNFNYRPDTYLTGQLGQTGGTGVTWLDNNRLGYAPTDAEQLQALSLSHNGKKLPKEQLQMAKDAFHAADYASFHDEALQEISGEPSEDEIADDEEQKPTIDGKMSEHQVRELLQRQAFDHTGNQEHWVRNSATGCGLCGGSGGVTMDEAVAFIQATNPDLRGVNPNSEKMQEYIAEHLRASESNTHDGQPNIACPECDQEHPDSHCGRVSDGICAHCHGDGELDPDRVDEYFGGHEAEDGGAHDGKKDSPHYGRHYDEESLRKLIQQRLEEEGKGKTGRNNFAAQMHQDAVKSGMIAPLTKLNYIRNLNKMRYAEKPKIDKSDKDYNLRAQQFINGIASRRTPKGEGPTGDPEQDANIALGDSREKLSGLDKAHHEHLILQRAEAMRLLALENEADPKEVSDAVNVIKKQRDDGTLAFANTNPNHSAITACNKLHKLATREQPDKTKFSLEGSKVKSLSGVPHENLRYAHGRWLTDAEKDEGLFEPFSKARPHLSIRDLKQMFAHSKPLIASLNRYLNEADFDPEKGEALLQLLADQKKPLVKQKLVGLSSSPLNRLYDEFQANDEEREHESVDMESAHLSWDKGLMDEMHAAGVSPSAVKDYLSVPTEEGDYGFNQGLRKGLDNEYQRAIKDIVKPMYVEYATLSGIKQFLEHYDDISHPNFHKKVQDAMKSEGLSADTRLSVDNFFEMTRGRGDLQAFARNEAARMLGYEDHEGLEKALNFSYKKNDFGDGRMSGKEFLNAAIENAKPSGSKKQALPMDLNQLYADSVAQKMSVNPEDQMSDAKIVEQMEELALYRHYPNWMRAQSITNIMAENGYGDAAEFGQAVKEGKVSPDVINAIKGVNGKARMFHPTLAWADYDKLELYDAAAHDPKIVAQQQQQGQGPRPAPPMPQFATAKYPDSNVPLFQPQGRTVNQPTVGPQPQPQPAPQVLPHSPLDVGHEREVPVSNLFETRQANRTVDEEGNPIQRDPPMQTEGAAMVNLRTQVPAYQQRMAGLNRFNRPLPDDDSQ